MITIKNRVFALFLFFPMLLTSCSSVMDENISFINENNVALCYIGKETKVFNKIKRYYDLSLSYFPQRNDVDNFILTIVDVGNKKDELSIAFLDKIYESLKWKCYSYVAFFNFDHSLVFLRNSKFGEDYYDFSTIAVADMVFFENNGTSLIRDNSTIFVANQDSDYDYYFNNTFSSLVWEVQKDLREM